MHRAIANEHARDLVRQVHPLVEVERKRVGALDSLERRREGGDEPRERAERTVDVEPEILRGAKIGERVEVVGRAAVHRARRSDHADRAGAREAVGGDHVAQRVDADAELAVDGHAPERGVPHAEQLNGLLRPAMDLVRRVDRQPLLRAEHAEFAHVEPGARMTRDREPEHIRHRAAAHQHAARVTRESHQLGEPGDHLQFDELRRLVESGAMRVHPGGEHVGHHAERRAVPLNPAPEAGMPVSVRERKHVRDEIVVCALGGLRLSRERLGRYRVPNVLGHRLPGTSVPERLQEIEGVVHHAVSEGTEGLPVGGVERFLDHDGGR